MYFSTLIQSGECLCSDCKHPSRRSCMRPLVCFLLMMCVCVCVCSCVGNFVHMTKPFGVSLCCVTIVTMP